MHKLALAVVLALGATGVQAAQAQNMTVQSEEVSDGASIKDEQVANVFGCKGGNKSPSLSWSDAPSDAKSFAITVYDPDAPTGSGFWHWVVFNIPAATRAIPKNAGNVKAKLMPKGAVQSRTDFGTDGYGGPCPPQGDKPTATSSPSMRSMKTSCSSPRTTTSRQRSSASNCTFTARSRRV
jgi:Raf kinase inhibitor-like YbhB/YbcL family protein